MINAKAHYKHSDLSDKLNQFVEESMNHIQRMFISLMTLVHLTIIVTGQLRQNMKVMLSSRNTRPFYCLSLSQTLLYVLECSDPYTPI